MRERCWSRSRLSVTSLATSCRRGWHLGGIRVGLEAIALSIISLGMVDAVAMLPLSISATATSSAGFRGPLLIVVAFGFCCCALLVASARLVRLPLLRRSTRLHRVSEHVSAHRTPGGRRDAIAAGLYLFTCWTARAVGTVLLLRALGFAFPVDGALRSLSEGRSRPAARRECERGRAFRPRPLCGNAHTGKETADDRPCIATACRRACALPCVSASPCSDSRTSPPLAFRGSHEREQLMRKSLRRVLEWLRAATSRTPRKRASIRGGLQQPQRMHALLVPARTRVQS